jgi:hypothetical protein
MRLSAKTKQRLIRYANATVLYESERRRVYFSDGHLEIPPSTPTLKEWSDARDDLKKCTEPKIKKLVHATQIDRLDDARSQTQVMKVADAYRLAENDLIGLGHKLKGAGKSKRRKTSRHRIRHSRTRLN